jgi:nickel/cobalt exporter
MRFAMTIIVLGCGGWAWTHPLPSFQFDRKGTVVVRASSIEIHYRLEVSLFAMAIDARGLLSPEDEKNIGGRQTEFARVYAARKSKLLADALVATIDGTPLALRPAVKSIAFEATHAIFEMVFSADRSAGTRFAFHDLTFEEKPGTVDWRFDSTDSPGDTLTGKVEPNDLRDIPVMNLTLEQAARRRKLAATLSVSQEPNRVESAPAAEPILPVNESLWSSLRSRGLVAFFDSTRGTGLLLFAALLFGAAHAVTPGHGKTLVAAYLVGERGTLTHAVLLGLTTTLSHTGSVIGVAFVLRWIYRDEVPETIQAILQLFGGLLIFGIGGWLLNQRLRNRADHWHWNLPRTDKPSWLRVALLGFAGGIVPCWDAVMLLLVAIAAGKLAWALPLLFAFSVGLAGVLVLLGMTVVLATRASGRRYGESTWFRCLPVISAMALVFVGLWLCRDGWQTLLKLESLHANR